MCKSYYAIFRGKRMLPFTIRGKRSTCIEDYLSHVGRVELPKNEKPMRVRIELLDKQQDI